MADVPWGEIIKYGAGALGTLGANEATQGAYRQILQNLKERFGDYENVAPAGYAPIAAPSLGPSALSTIEPDLAARQDQQEAIAKLEEISGAGGLTLADKAALDEIERTLNRNTTARQKGIENRFAASGQFGSGAQLASELSTAQDAAETANARGEGIAGQAQDRAMKAVLEKGVASRAMSNDDYAKKRAAADAEDAIRRYNASMSMDAGKYNNAIRGQAFDDNMKLLGGKHGVTSDINSTLLGSGKQQANTIAGLTYGGTGLIDTLSSSGRSGSTGYGTGAEHSPKHDEGSMTGGGNPSAWDSMRDDPEKEH